MLESRAGGTMSRGGTVHGHWERDDSGKLVEVEVDDMACGDDEVGGSAKG